MPFMIWQMSAMKFILRKKTPVDILIVPLLGVTIALVLGLLIRFPAIYVTYGIQFVVDKSTSAVPFVMGIVIAVLMVLVKLRGWQINKKYYNIIASEEI